MHLRTTVIRSQRFLRIFDWALAAASLAWGVYAASPWWIAGGVLGLALAWYDPGTRIRRYFDFSKPRPANPSPTSPRPR